LNCILPKQMIINILIMALLLKTNTGNNSTTKQKIKL
jgi:hypothetical protein